MSAGRPKCLIELELVPMEELALTGATRFWCGGVEFLHEGDTLFVRSSSSLLPLVRNPSLAGAIYFANGLVVGLQAKLPILGEIRRRM